MALSAGTKIGGYEIVAPIGAGGMGEVYRARDTRLKREVAIKVLPHAFANDAERLARFQREAELLATLNHPNIAQIHGLEDGALVLELVEGPTLADRLAQGAIPLDEALAIATQIAEALEAAHECGVIHRDLKPANIKLRDDGTVKILDFGLAKAMISDGANTNVSLSPTITSPAMTMGGVILGTAAYMSPEQARGKAVDTRADIWAFGCVLYEMLTGKRPFDGDEVTDVLARIIEREPNLDAVSGETPPSITRLLRRCLVKDRRNRLSHIGDARLELADALNWQPSEAPKSSPARASARYWWVTAILAVIALLTAVFATTAIFGRPALPVSRFEIFLREDQVFSNTGRHSVAMSPTGRHIAYVANGALHVRAMDQLESTTLKITDGVLADGAREVFFSPDGRWIGFWQGGHLKKIAVTGGAPIALARIEPPFGASWTTSNTILFGRGSDGIWQVSADGGTPQRVVAVNADQSAHGPQMLTDGEHLLFTVGKVSSWDRADLIVQSLRTGERKRLVEGARDGRYLPSGHIVYALMSTVFAAPIDIKNLQLTGSPVSLVEGVQHSGAAGPASQFSVSADGTLAYVMGTDASTTDRSLAWIDRKGQEEPIDMPTRPYAHPRLSPDGSRLMVESALDLWLWDFKRTTLTRITFDTDREHFPVWLPDGQRVIYSGRQPYNLFWQSADGTGVPERLIESATAQDPSSISTDGKWLAFEQRNASLDIHVMSLADRKVRPLLHSQFNERNGEFSPDGRWIAYESDESGQPQVYVRPFPNVDAGRWQLSTSGGTQPAWSSAANEIFYMAATGELMSVPFRSTESGQLIAGAPSVILKQKYSSAGPGWRRYDVDRDGRRFLMVKDSAATLRTAGRIVVVQNWIEELKQRVPTNRD